MYMVHIADFRDFPAHTTLQSAISSDTGAPSSNSFTLSFNVATRYAEPEATPVSREWGQQCPASPDNNQRGNNSPNRTQRSPSTCSAAARTLRFFSSLPDEVTRKKVYLPATQPRQLPSHAALDRTRRAEAFYRLPDNQMVITTRAMAFTNAASVVSLANRKCGEWWEDDVKIARRVGEKQGGSIGQHMTRIGQQCQKPERKPPTTSTSINPAVTPKHTTSDEHYYLLAGVRTCVSVVRHDESSLNYSHLTL